MPAKLLHLRVEFGVKPVGPRHGRAQVVNHQRPGHTPKIPKRIFQTADEALGRLSPHHLAVAFARMAQHHPEQMWSLALALHHHPRTLAKIHLRFGSRLHFHPYERDRLGLPQLPYKPFDRLITASESVVPDQILINPLGAQPHRHRRLNLRLPRQAGTLAATPGGRNGWFWIGIILRAGGQNGWFCRRISLRAEGRNGRF